MADSVTAWPLFCLAVILAGCRTSSPVLPAVPQVGVGPLGIVEIVHMPIGAPLKLQPGRWQTGYRWIRAVESGQLYELRMTTQVTSEAPHVKVETRLRVGQQEVGSGVTQSVSQPLETGGSHHSPVTALGLWKAERTGNVEFAADFRVEPQTSTAQWVLLDGDPAVPYGRFSLIRYGRWPAAGLGEVHTQGRKVPVQQGLIPGVTPRRYVDYWEWPVTASAGDMLVLFAQLSARQKRSDEIGPYARLYPRFDGEQVFTALSLDGENCANLYGENVCSQHPQLQAYQEAAVKPLVREAHRLRLQVCGAYGRGCQLIDHETRGFVLQFRPGSGLPLQEIREWKADGVSEGVVDCRPGDWVTLTALVNCQNPSSSSAAYRAELRLGQDSLQSQRTVGENYRYGHFRLELAYQARGRKVAWSLGGVPQSSYFLMRRFGP